MRFSEWLKLYREAADISQKMLAEKLDSLGYKITSGQISNYEREYDKDKDGNPTRPPEKFVDLTAQVLNRSIDEARYVAGYSTKKSVPLPPHTLEAIVREGILTERDDILLARLIDEMKQVNREEKEISPQAFQKVPTTDQYALDNATVFAKAAIRPPEIVRDKKKKAA